LTDSFQMPGQSPLYHAEHAARYERQQLIQAYQNEFKCRLVILVDNIFAYGITYFEELIYDANPADNLHLLLWSQGGDGETAVRLVRSAQARCRELTVIVPDQAKSAATLLALGAHHILMGPTSDLGPVDPQFQMPNGSLAAAKDIIAAVESAEKAVEARPETYALHAALLSDVTDLMVQQARLALGRTEDLMREALSSSGARSEEQVEKLIGALKIPLLEAKAHAAIFGAREAKESGLSVIDADPAGTQWQLIWRLWTKYFLLNSHVYEGLNPSKIWPFQTPTA
jgi:ATP-dependent protease ClpP protease subunit